MEGVEGGGFATGSYADVNVCKVWGIHNCMLQIDGVT